MLYLSALELREAKRSSLSGYVFEVFVALVDYPNGTSAVQRQETRHKYAANGISLYDERKRSLYAIDQQGQNLEQRFGY